MDTDGDLAMGHTERFTKTVTGGRRLRLRRHHRRRSPIHVDEELSKGTLFGSRIAHGALLVGFVSG